ncbi:MAG: lysophospholipid acyltransferase family protein [Balneolales bacterium]
MNTLINLFLWLAYGISLVIALPPVFLAWIAGYRADPHRIWPNRIFMFFGQNFTRLNPFWDKKISGLDKVDLSRPTIFVGNHQSFMDMPLLGGLPFKMKWVSKIELFRVPVVGWHLRMAGHISVDRGQKGAIQSLQNIQPYMEAGVPVMMFPEGTRSRKGDLKPFKNGAFIVAKEHNYCIQPIVIQGTYNILPPGEWLAKWKGKVFVSILDPVNPSDFNSMEELRDHTYHCFKTELNRLKQLMNAEKNKNISK